MKASSGVYLSRLDHLRLLAAFMVFMWHFVHFGGEHAYVPFGHVPGFPLLSLIEEGHTGVSLFMVVSGFIFMRLAAGQSVSIVPFYVNRLLRILPLFVVWCLFYVQSKNLDPVEVLVSSLFLLNRGAVPGIGWTVIVEVQFYVVFPFLVLFIQKDGAAYLLKLLALAVLFRFMVWMHSDSVQHVAYWTIFGRIDQFLCGMFAACCYERFSSGRRWWHWGSLIGGVLIATVALHGLNLQGGFYNNGVYPSSSMLWVFMPLLEGLGYALLLIGYLRVDIRIPPVIDRLLARGGEASYSIYWNHMFVIEIAGLWLTRTGVELSGLPAALAWGALLVFPFCVGLSLISYRLIERPFLSLRRPYLSHRL
ncbi:acyltransferase [Azoarcus sp. L1K30]|uniref:acyltransferase family protein n=1 Tax=Azoarcus sp. L1K30 TaxID=2820277 RepID=UPI001B83AE35|nr:acyltransferase [Azoarcus sp. L1K30]MBR0567240.1 acyltransferase [Azoarcus sp. L1K30]